MEKRRSFFLIKKILKVPLWVTSFIKSFLFKFWQGVIEWKGLVERKRKFFTEKPFYKPGTYKRVGANNAKTG
jgi:hypothetical protein